MNNRIGNQYKSFGFEWTRLAMLKAWLILAGLLLFGGNVVYADRYVAPTNPASASPYDNWGIAATNIQTAVDVATDGETVWLTNGIYFCQGVTNCTHSYYYSYGVASYICTNTAMVVITNAIKLRSWSGNYTNTVINGNFPAWTTTVVLVVNTNVVLDGLTITNGRDFATYNSNHYQPGVGGVYFKGALMTNCLITGNIKSNYWTGNGSGVLLANGIMTHCTVAGNRYKGPTDNDVGQALSFNDNIGSGPGPTFISNCVFTRNGPSEVGGPNSDSAAVGVMDAPNFPPRPGIVTKSVFANNYGHGFNMFNGGMTLSDCVIISNTGTGVRSLYTAALTVKNCLLTRNLYKGFEFACTTNYSLKFENCTIVSNGNPSGYGIYVYNGTAGSGAVTNSTVANCIVYDNDPNWYDNKGTNMIYTNCCTTPVPTNQPGLPQGTGNITSAPLFVNGPARNYHLSSQSPCINTGAYRSWMAGAGDLEGNKRIFEGVVDMGAYEFRHKGTMFRIQ